MNKWLGADWPAGEWHVPEDDLLPFLDGELPDKEAKKIRRHLEACWNCRARIEAVERTISAVVEYHNHAYVRGLPPPPGGWRTFDSELKSVAAETRRRLVTDGWLLHQIAPLRGLSGLERLAVGMCAAALLIAVTLIFYRAPVVSASQVIAKGTEARIHETSAVAHPIVYQKLRLQAGSQTYGSLTWEIWNDEESGNTNQRIEDSAGARFIPTEWGKPIGRVRQARDSRIRRAIETRYPQSAPGNAGQSLPPLLRELRQVFQANHMDWRRPLAVAGYASWAESIGHLSPELRETYLPSGERAYVLIASVKGPLEINAIARTELTVRSWDWHPLKQRFEVKDGNKIESLDLAELAFNVSSADTYIAGIGVEKRSLSFSLRPSPAAVSEIESLEAEIQARYALHRAGACIGEPVEVHREPSGRVLVEGLVQPPERREQLEQILSPILLVDVKIHGPGDLSPPHDSPRFDSLQSEMPERWQSAEAGRGGIPGKSPIEDQLRDYFTHLAARDDGNGPQIPEPAAVDQEVTALSNQAVALSEAALAEAWALRRLAEAYPQAKTDQLSPGGRQLLAIMLTEHLAALKLHIDQSRVLLKPVLSSVVSQTPPPAEEEGNRAMRSLDTSEATWRDTILRLWTSAQQMEKLAGYLFTGATWPEQKEKSARDLMDDLNEIDIQFRQTEAMVADGFSGYVEETGNREAGPASLPR
jgi:hypothetical protein